MIAALPGKQQRWIAIGLLIAVLIVVFSVIVLPLWSANTSRQEIIQVLGERLANLRRMADEDATLRPRLELLKRAQIENGHYLKGSSETVAAAELQRLVKSISGGNNITVTSTRIMPASKEEDFVRIEIRIRLRGSLTGIIESVYDLESNETFLFLNNLSLHDASRRRPTRAIVAKPVDAELEIAAYMADGA